MAAIKGLREVIREKECEIEMVRAEKDTQIVELQVRPATMEELMKQTGAKGGAR